MIYKEFIQKIAEAIERKKCTLKDVARYANIDISYLSRILSGKRNPPYKEEVIRRIAKYLNIDEEELIFSAGKIPAKYQRYFSNSANISKIIKYFSTESIKDKIPNKNHLEVNPPQAQNFESTDTPDELL
ncbi:MAG: helix-turn-helix domain-containing protein [Endomicrobia bacterium]|nr:helix-turn-helix domain-containing protein [Endomicrobiia bacterium]MDW8055192.1 helix-turn-helix transcriptional regulator [Elusimicrobiota bacterium]